MDTGKSSHLVASGGNGMAEGARRNVPPGASFSRPTSMTNRWLRATPSFLASREDQDLRLVRATRRRDGVEDTRMALEHLADTLLDGVQLHVAVDAPPRWCPWRCR
jgi:hypothetical protein